MDDQSKNQAADNPFSYSGVYPQDQADEASGGGEPSPPAAPSSPPPVNNAGTSPSDSAPTATVPFAAPTAPPPQPFPPTTTDTSPFSTVPASTEPAAQAPPPPLPDTTAVPPAPPPTPDNPFVVSAETPPQVGKKGHKRLIAVLILLVALIVVGFVAFQLISRFMQGNQPVVLTYWGLWESEAVMAPLIQEYQQTHPNVQIAYSQQSPRAYRERLQAAIDRGEGPDIFRFHNTWLPMLISSNDLAPAGATGYTADEFQQTFYPVATMDLVLEGRVYGVPLMFDGLALFYNEDLLRAAGVSPPTTWEQFRNAALQLTVKDENGQIITAGAALGVTGNVEHYSDIVALMMLQNGADLKNPIGQEAADALSFYHLYAEAPNNVWDMTLDNSIMAFSGGRVGFVFGPSWQIHVIRLVNPELKFRVIPVPQLPGTNTTWASYWVEGVSSQSSHQEEAWEFLKFLSSRESLTTMYTTAVNTGREFGEPYSRVDLAQTIINDPYVGAYIQQAQTAQSFYLASRTYDNGINDQLIKYIEDAINSLDQGVSPQAAMETATQGFNQILSRYGFRATTQ